MAAFRLICLGDHPRLRGEHRWWGLPCPRSRGSSPPARGTQTRGYRPGGKQRIIPACAGNTAVGNPAWPFPKDHPRLRGEHRRRHRRVQRGPGSSPPARGTLAANNDRGWCAGIIPACAGNTAILAVVQLAKRDHPRLRGEHRFVGVSEGGKSGSSPPARGTLGKQMGVTAGEGIIPACAGNTGGRQLTPRQPRDHPRLRGEHFRVRVDSG